MVVKHIILVHLLNMLGINIFKSDLSQLLFYSLLSRTLEVCNAFSPYQWIPVLTVFGNRLAPLQLVVGMTTLSVCLAVSRSLLLVSALE
jgi:hypothetical protein